MAHFLVIANETVGSKALLDTLRATADPETDRISVVAPVSEPRQGYVVYEGTRRTSARRRLDRTLEALREAGLPANGFVYETGPVQAAKDALAQLMPPVDRIIVSTHAPESSGWLRRNVVEEIRRAVNVPVDHVIGEERGGEPNILVVANQTVLSDELMARIRARAAEGGASFLIVSPQDDREGDDESAADLRMRQALTELRGEGIDVHGMIVHPDPFTAVRQMTHDERIDEIIVSTFPGERSGWLRRDLVGRLRKETGLPIEHIISTSTPS